MSENIIKQMYHVLTTECPSDARCSNTLLFINRLSIYFYTEKSEGLEDPWDSFLWIAVSMDRAASVKPMF